MNHRARRAKRLSTAAGAVLLVAGIIAIVVALRAKKSAPQPPRSAASQVDVTPTTPSTPHPSSPSSELPTGHRSSSASSHPPTHKPSSKRSSPHTRGPILKRSRPTELRVPAINVKSDLLKLGLNKDGTVQVPPLSRNSRAGWYKHSPTPGQLGPSVILGHIDSAKYGPGVFFRLGKLRQRDKIYVTLADHRVAVFEVEKVVEYKKKSFPTLTVYGNTDHAALRLITCGGTFDPSKHSYEDNIVAYAALVSSHHS
jgi:sortase (surface protein transpeptidase)